MASGEDGICSSSSERSKVTDLAGGGWEEERGALEEVGREGEWARGVFRHSHLLS